MDKKYFKLLREEKEAFDAFLNEPPFPASEFAEEILPVIGDYFVGEFKLDGQDIICSFPNGQKFRITVRESK